MKLVCPECGSANLRFAHMRTVAERLCSLGGIRPLRCRECKTRFSARVWTFSDLSYARCPKCRNMRLGYWSPAHYHVPFARGLLLLLGARPLRCEACRHNFVSFRRRKYRRHHSRRTTSPAGESTGSVRSTGR
jgi:DNA-directed RNA polymerase subunit RPC12/RpoP